MPPEIWAEVITYTDTTSRRRLRSVCRAVRDEVDAITTHLHLRCHRDYQTVVERATFVSLTKLILRVKVLPPLTHLLSSVRTLHAPQCRVPSPSLIALRHHSLTELSLRQAHVDQNIFRVLACCTSLQFIDLTSSGLTCTELHLLAMLPQLHTLCLDGNRLDDRAASSLVDCPSLQVLSLEHTGITDVTVNALARQLSLLTLDIGRNRLSGACIGALAANKTLRYLRIGYNNLKDDAAVLLSRHVTLRRLAIQANHLTDSGAIALAHSKTLRALNIARNCVGLAGLLALQENARLTHLDVSDNNIHRERLVWGPPNIHFGAVNPFYTGYPR